MILEGKRVLITGGTGSLGKAVLHRAEQEGWNTEFTIFSRDETKQSQLRAVYPQHNFILGDVAKERDMRRAMRGIDVVLHFAAYKQVPSSQNNVPATIETNIIGSQVVVDAAIDMGVEKVVASSTDKACAPANLYGVSKAAMESIFQHANKLSTNTTFHLARYGNVIGSNASVIPLFLRQIQKGTITITHKDMTRFWISLDTAVDLILEALHESPGTIVVPKAPALSVKRVAEIIAENEDVLVDVEYIGIRPGEKMHEAMVALPESYHTTESSNRFYILPPTAGFENEKAPFEYTSDQASKLPKKDLIALIEDYKEKYT